MKKILFIIISVLFFAIFSAKAIQKSENLDKTVSQLRIELVALQQNVPVDIVKFQKERETYISSLQTIDSKIDELSIVVYSQRNHNIFSMAASCKEVITLVHDFNRLTTPHLAWEQVLADEVTRYSQLRNALLAIPNYKLSAQSQSACLLAVETADSIISMFLEVNELLTFDKLNTEQTQQKLTALDTYSGKQYEWLTKRIFLDGSTSYFDILGKIGVHSKLFVNGINQIFTFYKEDRQTSYLQYFINFFWRSLIVLFICFLVVFVFFRFVLLKYVRTEQFLSKQKSLIFCATLLLYLIVLFIYSAHFHQGESKLYLLLFLEYFLTIFVITSSLTLRLPSQQFRNGLMLYLPLLCIGFLPLLFRFFTVQNSVVHFLFPPLLLATVIWYIFVLIKNQRNATRTDIFYAWFSFSVLLICLLISWMGYRYLSLLLLMLWLTFLTTIQILVTIGYFISKSEKKHHHTNSTTLLPWYSEMLNRMILPALIILSIVASLYWTAGIFDLSTFLNQIVISPFLAVPKVISLSVSNVVWLLLVAIVVNYCIFATKEILRSIFKDRYEAGAIPVFISIGTLFVWAIYISAALIILQVDPSGIVVVMGGFSMGIGFAMKDTIENFICGLSLMMGRVRTGDMIECDAIRGNVVSVGYRSTLIETLDGSIIAFLNTQLFAKTFKNLTRNHGFEMGKIMVGVAYSTDIDKAREVILEATLKVDKLQHGKTSVVLLDTFNSSSIDLAVIVWVPVRGRGGVLSAVREEIYKAFTENNISIPFPQQDVYLHKG